MQFLDVKPDKLLHEINAIEFCHGGFRIHSNTLVQVEVEIFQKFDVFGCRQECEGELNKPRAIL